MKADNRAAASRIGDVLALAGLHLVPRNGIPWSVGDQATVQERIEENLELLAEGEHDGWVEARVKNGWRLGPKKNIDRREHNLLVPYTQFQEHLNDEKEVESQKEKDRDSVRNYVEIIKLTDLRITSQRP